MFNEIFMISISLFKNYDLGFNWMLKTKTRAYHKQAQVSINRDKYYFVQQPNNLQTNNAMNENNMM